MLNNREFYIQPVLYFLFLQTTVGTQAFLNWEFAITIEQSRINGRLQFVYAFIDSDSFLS